MNRIRRAADALGVRTPRNTRENLIKLSVVLIALAGFVFNAGLAEAATLNTASLSLSNPQDSITPTTYKFQASGYTTGTPIECIEEVYATTSTGNTEPGGMTTASVTLDAGSSVITPGSWGTNVSVTDGTVVFQDSSGQTPSASGTFTLDTVTNPNTDGTYWMQYSTWTSTTAHGCTGTEEDSTTVGFTITTGSTLSLTVNPTLTFSVAGVTGGATCAAAGQTEAVTSTPTTLPFGTVTSGANTFACQDLLAATNSTNGYTVFARYTAKPTNALTETINDVSSGALTNASPGSFTAAGVEGYGYTTSDQNLTGGTATRFYNGTTYNWAAMTTVNEPVSFEAAGVTSSTFRVTHQVGISTVTFPGTYTTTVIYTCTPVY